MPQQLLQQLLKLLLLLGEVNNPSIGYNTRYTQNTSIKNQTHTCMFHSHIDHGQSHVQMNGRTQYTHTHCHNGGLGFTHNAIVPPHLTAFATKGNFENNAIKILLITNTSIYNIFDANKPLTFLFPNTSPYVMKSEPKMFIPQWFSHTHPLDHQHMYSAVI